MEDWGSQLGSACADTIWTECMSHLFDYCIMVSQIWAWDPLSSKMWWPRGNPVGWVGIQVCQHLDIGKDGRLGIKNLQTKVSGVILFCKRYLTLIVVI